MLQAFINKSAARCVITDSGWPRGLPQFFYRNGKRFDSKTPWLTVATFWHRKERKEEAESANKFFVRAGRKCVRETPGLKKTNLTFRPPEFDNHEYHVS